MQREPPLDPQNPPWSETSDVIPMFATPVWKIELEAQLREAIRAQPLAAIARLRRDLAVPARDCSRIWSRANTSTRSQRLQRPIQFARATSGGGGTAIISAVTAANVADHQSRDPFGCMHLTPDKLQNSQV